MKDATSIRRPLALLRKNVWYLLSPLAFVLAPMLAFFSRNVTEVLISEAITATVLMLSAALVVEAVFMLPLRSAVRGAMLSSVAFAVFFSYGLLVDSVPLFRITIAGVPVGPNKVLYLSIAVAMAGAVAFAVKGSDAALDSAWRVVRATGFALLASGLSILVYAAATVPHTADSLSLPALEGSEAVAGSTLPDIYYIVLDGYLGRDALLAATGYDNSPFIEALEARGFFVAEDSYSNYYNTDQSVLSILNMEYLPRLEAQLKAQGHDWDPEYLARNNHVMQRLREAGYRIVVVRSPYGPLARVDGADVVLDPSSPYMNDLTANLLQSTMLRALSTSSLGSVQRRRILKGFEYAARTSAEESPKCVFVHVLVPHQPFAFDEAGNLPTSEIVYSQGGSATERRGYAEQLRYTNRLTTQLLDGLFEDVGERPVIIVVQGDHGSRFGGAANGPWTRSSSTAQEYAEFYSILNAFYFSAGRPEALDDSISSVNTFRLVLNEAIGTQYPLLEDRSYSYRTTPEGGLVDLTDVTQELAGSKEPTPGLQPASAR